jgi:uncharacterized protein (TIGR03067 family)
MTDEMRKFQGTWRQVACDADGAGEPPDERGWEPRTTITGDRFVVALADGRVVIEGTYALDPATEPKAVDWTDTVGADAGKTFPAIYSLEGDRLTFCAADDGQPRPTAFKAGPGWVVRVLVREAH